MTYEQKKQMTRDLLLLEIAKFLMNKEEGKGGYKSLHSAAFAFQQLLGTDQYKFTDDSNL